MMSNTTSLIYNSLKYEDSVEMHFGENPGCVNRCQQRKENSNDKSVFSFIYKNENKKMLC